jgi:elongation factor P--(R)-beta-lysine ligase
MMVASKSKIRESTRRSRALNMSGAAMSEQWRPTASVDFLERRGQLLWRVRSFFQDRGYVEVQTPTLSRDTVVDRYIDPVPVPGSGLACPAADAAVYYLQSSPEFAMKRLMAAGMDAIYQIAPAFRAGERGAFHNPEFTMLEWYRRGQTFQQAVAELAELAGQILGGLGGAGMGVPQVMTYQAAFLSTAGVDPLACSVAELRQAASRAGVELGGQWEDERDEWLNLVFAECVQPQLGTSAPVIVTHYPASQAALAQVCPRDARVAERYELFARGVELANGYHELLDPDELERRAVATAALRRGDGKEELPTHSQLLEAMRVGMPPCSGCALGLDRLVMLALGAAQIEEVLAFPMERA